MLGARYKLEESRAKKASETADATKMATAESLAQLKAVIRHFASRKAMDIEGLGDKLIDQWVGGEIVTNVA